MRLGTSGIWGCEEDGLMNMVKSPQSSVQPVELEFTLCTMAWQLWRQSSCLAVSFLPVVEIAACMLDYGKDQQYDEVQTHVVGKSRTS